MARREPPPVPLPDAEAVAHSDRLRERIDAAIAMAGGAMDFADYMALVLYAPGLGYYSAGQTRFGPAGDFTTAPLVSALFSRTLAHEVSRVLSAVGGDTVLEFGAGTGQMALDVLIELDRLGAAPRHYWIVEVSGDLRAAQAQTLAALPAHLRGRVEWLERLPAEPLRGAVLANEVLDALPVRRFLRTGDGVENLAVAIGEDGALRWQPQPADQALRQAVAEIEADLGGRLPADYSTEWCPSLGPWIAALGDVIEAGAALLIDYGYPRREYYHPQRATGTLLCHYRHRAHDDPFFRPGLQDITASVDFTAAARAGIAAGLELLGFATQGNFLAGAGLPGLIEASAADDPQRAAELAQQAKPLLFPDEMGERFKVLGLGRGIEATLPGLAFADHRMRL